MVWYYRPCIKKWDLGFFIYNMMRERCKMTIYIPYLYGKNDYLGGVWEQSFSAVLEEYCSILKYCSIIYIMVFGKLCKISVFKTEVLQIL
jgi:hypothetical protein